MICWCVVVQGHQSSLQSEKLPRLPLLLRWPARQIRVLSRLLSGAKSTPAAAPKQTADHKPARHRSVKSAHRSAVIGHGHQSSSKPVIQRLSDMGVNPLQSIRRGRAASELLSQCIHISRTLLNWSPRDLTLSLSCHSASSNQGRGFALCSVAV